MNTQARLSAGFSFWCSLNKQPLTEVEIRAAHRMNAALLKQTREKMRDQSKTSQSGGLNLCLNVFH